MEEEIDMSSFLKNTPTTVLVKAVFQLLFFENRISHSKILLLRKQILQNYASSVKLIHSLK